jgi:serine/threonine protein kinase
MRMILNGLLDAKKLNICHRDMKSANILVHVPIDIYNTNFTYKIAD